MGIYYCQLIVDTENLYLPHVSSLRLCGLMVCFEE